MENNDKDFDPKTHNDQELQDRIDSYDHELNKDEKNKALTKGALSGLGSLAMWGAIDIVAQQIASGFTEKKEAAESLIGDIGKSEGLLAKITKTATKEPIWKSIPSSVVRYAKASPLSASVVAGVAVWDGYNAFDKEKGNIENSKNAEVGQAVRELRHRGYTLTPREREAHGKWSAQAIEGADKPSETQR